MAIKVGCKFQHPTITKGKDVDIIVGKDKKEWFKGKDVCEILGYENVGQALRDQVKKAYKTDLKSILMDEKSSPTPNTNNEGKAVYISQPGLYQLIFSSRLKLAEA